MEYINDRTMNYPEVFNGSERMTIGLLIRG